MRARRLVLIAVVAASLLLGAGCSSTTDSTAGRSGASDSSAPGTSRTGGTSPVGTTIGSGPCPVEPVPVVVSVDQWGDIVEQLGGACTEVTTIVAGTSADPHDYEPTAADTATFGTAKLVVVNGVDYDPWAQKAVDALSTKPEVVDGGAVVGADEGANPHIWYGPEDVDRIASAITRELIGLAPGASAYFEERAAAWQASMQPYRDEIATVRTLANGKTYAATESVFDEMAEAVGLRNVTPEGYRNAAANESEPAPGDVNQFQQALKDDEVDVLVYNTQTEGAVPELIRDTASGASVPVVEVTETVAPGATSFVQWQVDQLRALAQALR